MSTASLQVVQLSYRHRQSPVDGPICGRGSRQARRHGFRPRSPHPLSTPLVYRTEKDGTKQRDFGKARSSSRVFLPALMTAHVLQPRPRPRPAANSQAAARHAQGGGRQPVLRFSRHRRRHAQLSASASAEASQPIPAEPITAEPGPAEPGPAESGPAQPTPAAQRRRQRAG